MGSCPIVEFQEQVTPITGFQQRCGSTSIFVCPTQIYTAEEKAALAMYNFEENKRKEERVLADMQARP